MTYFRFTGDPEGMVGIDATHLNTPTTVTMDSNETHLYVSDALNNRIQMYTLV